MGPRRASVLPPTVGPHAAHATARMKRLSRRKLARDDQPGRSARDEGLRMIATLARGDFAQSFSRYFRLKTATASLTIDVT